jgi:hypothetical protein
MFQQMDFCGGLLGSDRRACDMAQYPKVTPKWQAQLNAIFSRHLRTVRKPNL